MSKVYRDRGGAATAWICVPPVVAYCIYGLVVSIGKVELWIVAFVVLTIAGLLMVWAREARAGSRTTHDGVEVRNSWRTVFVPWDEIERFSAAEHGPGSKIGILERRDGERIAMRGIQGGRSVERVIERLNEELRRRRIDAQADDHATEPG